MRATLLPSPRTRRGLAALALAGVLVLTGCAQDRNPDQAVRVGDFTVSNAEVEATAAPLVATLTNAGAAGSEGQVRSSTVQLLIVHEASRRLVAEQGLTPAAPDYAGIASSLQSTEDNAYVRLEAETTANLNALREAATPRDPTDAEVRDIYDRLLAIVGEAAGAQQPTVDDMRTELASIPDYAKALGLRDELLDALDRYGLVVNPRYQPLVYVLYQLPVAATGEQFTLVTVPLGEQGTGAVRPA